MAGKIRTASFFVEMAIFALAKQTLALKDDPTPTVIDEEFVRRMPKMTGGNIILAAKELSVDPPKFFEQFMDRNLPSVEDAAELEELYAESVLDGGEMRARLGSVAELRALMVNMMADTTNKIHLSKPEIFRGHTNQFLGKPPGWGIDANRN